MAEEERVPIVADLPALAQAATGQGALWARETADLDVNVVAFPAGAGVGAHVNDQVDVLVVVVAGAGVAEVEGRSYRLAPGTLVLIPRGARRAIRSTTDSLVYVTCHRRRPRLRPTAGPPRRDSAPAAAAGASGSTVVEAESMPPAGAVSPRSQREGAPPPSGGARPVAPHPRARSGRTSSAQAPAG